MRRLVATVALIAVGLVLTVPTADAHALLASSQPAAGALLDRAPSSVTLTFTEAPDLSLASIHVLDTSGRQLEQGKPAVVPGQRNSLVVGLRPLSRGSYTVTWRTTSVVDGHTTAGSFAFGVGVKPSATSTAQVAKSPRPSTLGVAGRFLLYAGLALLLGATMLAALGAPPRTRGVVVAWVAAAIGDGVLVADFTHVSGAPLHSLFRSGAGGKVGTEALAVLAAGAAVGLLAARAPRRIAWPLVALTTSGAVVARVWAGHAAASSVPWATVATQCAHVLAIGVWVGGLPWLLFALRGRDDAARSTLASRFSRVAALALLTTVGTGTARAISEVGSWRGLVDTGFGQVLLVKLALVAVVIAFGAVNRYRNVRPRVLRTEAFFAATVLATTALLTGLAPAASVTASHRAPRGVTVSAHDFGTTTRVRLFASPGEPGINHFEARVTDYDSGRPVRARRVTLRLTARDRADIPTASVDLTRVGDRWAADSGALAVGGTWSVSVIVETATGGIDVPLTLRTRQPPTRITAQPAAGAPTLYTITQGTRRAQTYVEPGRTGFNEVHFTFLDLGGNEVPAELQSATARRAGEKRVDLQFRQLEPGHYVADATLAKGTWRFSFRTADGFAASFTQRI